VAHDLRYYFCAGGFIPATGVNQHYIQIQSENKSRRVMNAINISGEF